MTTHNSTSVRISASITLLFSILMCVFLVKIMKSQGISGKSDFISKSDGGGYCGLATGWKVFTIILLIYSILIALGAFVALIMG